MLHPVAELRQDFVRHVGRVLGDEKHPHALGADQPHHLLDLVHQRIRCVCKQQVRFVEEEHQFRLVEVACFGQVFEQFG